MWDSVIIVLNIETCTIVQIGTLHCTAIKKHTMQYNTMQVSKQRLNDAKLLIVAANDDSVE